MSSESVPPVTIGVIVTLYNDYQYLEQCVSNLVGATVRHRLRICFCIDTSRYTSAAKTIVDGLVRRYGLDVDFAYNCEGGPSVSRNNGIRLLMRYDDVDYLFFMDADNYLGAGSLDILVDCLAAAPEDVAFTYQDIIKFGRQNQFVRLDVAFHKWRLLNEFYGETGNLVKAGVFRESEEFFFDESELIRKNTGEDVAFFRKLSARYRGVYCPGTKFYYRTKLVHRDEVYWPKIKLLTEHMRKNNRELYEDAERDFFRTAFYSVFELANFCRDHLIAGVEGEVNTSSRPIFSLRPEVQFFLVRDAFEGIVRSSLKGILLTELFQATPPESCRLFVFESIQGDNEPFSYRRQKLRLDAMPPALPVHLVSFPAEILANLELVRNKRFDVEIITIRSRHIPVLAPLTSADVLKFLDEVVAIEDTRKPVVDLTCHSEVYTFRAHNEWLRGELKTDNRYIGSQLEQLASKPTVGGKKLAVIAPFVGIGGSDTSTIELIRRMREAFPEASVDLVLAHFRGSESGVNQGDNHKQLDKVLPWVENVIFTDFIPPALREAFLTTLLSNYHLLHVETSAPVYPLFKEIKSRGLKPAIVSHLYCWDYFKGMRVGFPIFAPQYENVIDAFSCQTRLIANYLRTKNVQHDKIFHIPYRSRFHGSADVVKVGGHELKIIWIGRWSTQKNPELLLDIMEKVLPGAPNISFRVVAIADYDNRRNFNASSFSRLKRLERKYPSQVFIHHPWVDDRQLIEIYSHADILLNTSRWEGIPFTFYEAMSFGCIPVATNVSANVELVNSGVNGYLLDLQDASEFSDILMRLAADAELRSRLRVGVDTCCREGADFFQSHLQLFRDLLDGRLPVGYWNDSSEADLEAVLNDELAELVALAARHRVTLSGPFDLQMAEDSLLARFQKGDRIEWLRRELDQRLVFHSSFKAYLFSKMMGLIRKNRKVRSLAQWGWQKISHVHAFGMKAIERGL